MEALFARQTQSEAFLMLLSGGVLLGAALQGLSAVRRRMPRLALVTDALFATLVLSLLLTVMLRWMGVLRLYALLGIALGMLLYEAGVKRVVSAMGRRRGRRKGKKTAP